MRKIYGRVISESLIRKYYVDEGLSLLKIAKMLGCSEFTVRRRVKALGMSRPRGRPRKNGPPKGPGPANFARPQVTKGLIGKIRRSADKRGISLEVDQAFLSELFKTQGGRCALSGVPLQLPRDESGGGTTASLDRIDSGLGYTPINVQWVHKEINRMKGCLEDKSFIQWCMMVTTHNGSLNPINDAGSNTMDDTGSSATSSTNTIDDAGSPLADQYDERDRREILIRVWEQERQIIETGSD